MIELNRTDNVIVLGVLIALITLCLIVHKEEVILIDIESSKEYKNCKEEIPLSRKKICRTVAYHQIINGKKTHD